MQRRKFSREFKIEAVRLVGERGVSVAQASREGLSHCHGASAERRRLRDFQAAAPAVRHVSIATARSARCV